MVEKYRILAVDDDKDILELLSYNLANEGYDVVTLTKSVDVFKVARKFQPHRILLEIMMPDIDGVTLCHQLRSDITFSETFIIFLTARGEEYSEVTGFESGADDYIVKPIRPRALLSRINSMLRRKGKRPPCPRLFKRMVWRLTRPATRLNSMAGLLASPRKSLIFYIFLPIIQTRFSAGIHYFQGFGATMFMWYQEPLMVRC